MQRRSAFVVRAVDNKNRPNGRLRTRPRMIVTANNFHMLEPKEPSGKGYWPLTNTPILEDAGVNKDHHADYTRCWCNTPQHDNATPLNAHRP